MVAGESQEPHPAGADAVAAFIAEAGRAAEVFSELGLAESMQLPAKATRGIAILEQAIAVFDLAGETAAADTGWPPRCETKRAGGGPG